MTPERALTSIDRYGQWVLLAVFVLLLGGRFTLDRLGALPSWDLRWAGAAVIGLMCVLWATTARESIPSTGTGALFCWFLAWAGWMALTAWWAPRGARAGAVLVDLVLLVGLVWTGWSVAGRLSMRALGSLWWWVYAVGWLYFVGALTGPRDPQGRYTAFGGGANVFVRIMGLAVVAALVLAATRRKRWVLLGLPAFVTGAYLSGSRGGLLALLVVILVGGLPLLRRMGAGLRGALLGGVICAVALADFVVNPTWLAFGEKRFIEQTYQQGYDSQRTAIIHRALELFDQHPWLGTGLDGFFPLQVPWTNADYPHNLFVATAAEGGLIGIGLLATTLAVGAVALFQLRPLNTDALGFGLAALLVLVAAQFSGDYYDSRFLWFFLGLAVVATRRHQRAVGRARPQYAQGAETPESAILGPAR